MDEIKKYIIEFSEDPTKIKLLKMKNGKDGLPVFEFKTVTPYKEPDIESIRKEAYDEGFENGRGGFNDIWECVKKIFNLNVEEREIVFGRAFTQDVIKDYSASEAIEKIRAYEQEQKEEKPIPVEDVMRRYLDMFCKGRSCTGCVLHDFTCGNGTHFLSEKHPVPDEEVRRAYAEVMQKMRNE